MRALPFAIFSPFFFTYTLLGGEGILRGCDVRDFVCYNREKNTYELIHAIKKSLRLNVIPWNVNLNGTKRAGQHKM